MVPVRRWGVREDMNAFNLTNMENRDENTQHLIQESHAQFAHLYQQSNQLADTIAINLDQTTKQYENLKEGFQPQGIS